MKHTNSFADYTADELKGILLLAEKIKKDQAAWSHVLDGKKLYTLFEKTSNRTYLSFVIGMEELGGKAYNQKWSDSNFTIGDLMSEVKYVCRNVDCIMGRFKKAETTLGFMKNATVPVINGCDNTFHPTQALADMLTLYEKTGRFDAKVLYIGAKNNTYNSLSEIVSKLGGTLYGLTPFSQVMAIGDTFYDDLKQTGHYVELPTDISKDELKKVVADVDCVYTDTWVDMEFFTNPGYAEKKDSIINMMMPYQIDAELMAETDTLVFHDMPIHPGFEITQDIMEQHLETILDEAENRRHAEKGLLVYLLTGTLG
ncbi:ornithine carbamoyltransferase [Megasphaera cerevisiae DSM 20462]|jgi:ornithine carbamoyltransferase|uniref:Ornithine carbamoyltransferase n=1 Tax=Megasphaera cerevisiae DSM 20462 TaxID=1122219 RepID=A0A0J6ZN13_9FIRM|nr:ornithine carbamoyltransferase [Megasphaera cerevisiae]KMO86291.1 ornithine carbamoyltransferase [Megasphaera cerevisiae DSM 20462]MCI1751121.1 ornithine carbamoyltransferase [Megasphaera cerevisiae]OKY53172.1 ornithine carbamoyltransferase [Megasphaera cerevisiae]SJZ44922.1 ornithine carbamoyltransferase [Megasphaera cerevisiae DSM 20462]